MQQSYNTVVLRHFDHPQNVGWLDTADLAVGTGIMGTAASGDVIRLQIKINQHHVIEQAKFKAQAAVSIIAACSWITHWLQGKTLQAAAQLQSSDIVTALSLPALKMHSALLVVDAVKAAIADWQQKNVKKNEI